MDWQSNNPKHKKTPERGRETNHAVFRDYSFYVKLTKMLDKRCLNFHENWWKQLGYLVRIAREKGLLT